MDQVIDVQVEHKVTKPERSKRKPRPKVKKEFNTLPDQMEITEVPTIKKTKRKAYNYVQHSLSAYNKMQILNCLQREGWKAENVYNLISSFTAPTDSTIAYLNKQAELAEEHVHQECGSFSFCNISSWLKLFHDTNLSEHCCYEPAIIMNAITETEEHPEPEDLGEINLKAAYRFLTNGLLGVPQPEENEQTRNFLINEFQLLIDEANTDDGDKRAIEMRFQLHNDANLKEQVDDVLLPLKLSLDPLLLQHIDL